MRTSQYCLNPYASPELDTAGPGGDALRVHRQAPGYAETPLVELKALANRLGVGAVRVKDESARFGLPAFKVLGPSYALFRWAEREWRHRFGEILDAGAFWQPGSLRRLGDVTLATATDGNHGRAVAWLGKQLGLPVVIHVPEAMVVARREAILSEGAELVVVDGTYDDTVRRADDDASRFGWQVLSDTSWPGYTEIPGWITDGYATLFHEIDAQLNGEHPDVVILQGGVGSFSSAGVRHYRAAGRGNVPKIVCVEPLEADCLLCSIRSPGGGLATSPGRQDSIMSGLNCGEPSELAWPILRAGIDLFLAVDDSWAESAVRVLFQPEQGDPVVRAGEAGAAGLAGLLALLEESGLAGAREKINLGAHSSVLVVVTEGATDPSGIDRILGRNGSRRRE